MQKEYEIEWTETARDDLNEIVDYIALDGINNAIKINDKLISKVQSLNYLATRGRVVPELRKFGIEDYQEIIVTPYRIFFKIENNSKVVILGILDGRRDLLQMLIQRFLTS